MTEKLCEKCHLPENASIHLPWTGDLGAHTFHPLRPLDKPKPYVAYGHGYSGDFDTFEEANACVKANSAIRDNGAIYTLASPRVSELIRALEVARKRLVDNGNHDSVVKVIDAALSAYQGKEGK